MSDEFRKLTREEIDELAGEALPERAAMSLVNANIAIPVNAAVARRTSCSDGRDRATPTPLQTHAHRPEQLEAMGEKSEYQKLSREELDKLAGEALPERAAMSLINANVAAPVNLAVALNVASDNSVAYANAEQTADIDQSN